MSLLCASTPFPCVHSVTGDGEKPRQTSTRRANMTRQYQYLFTTLADVRGVNVAIILYGYIVRSYRVSPLLPLRISSTFVKNREVSSFGFLFFCSWRTEPPRLGIYILPNTVSRLYRSFAALRICFHRYVLSSS